jgi:ATP-dependent DNA helicase
MTDPETFSVYEPSPSTQAPADLDEQKFTHLNALLDQTTIYSKFLSEQMEGLDEEKDAERARKKQKKSAKDAPGAKGKKGGGASASGENEQELSETKKLLPMMTVEMRDYQLKGVRWLVALYQNGLNGILADQMGLGKTVQTIGFLSHLRNKGILGPYLILGPLSTLSNWINEFNRFCPDFPAVLYHGSKTERAEIRAKRLPTSQPIKPDFPVIVTSFEIVMADRKFLQKYNFKYLVVDEGHRLKNFDCKLIRELKFIPTANKLLLTGTPLQNSLPELWSLLHFLLPDVFTSLSQFQGWFDFETNDNENATDEEASKRVKVVEKLHGILKPFLLRRLKGDVETNLPRKKEIVLYAHMVETQKKFNDALVDKTIGDMLQKLSGGSAPVGATALNNMLMQLRKNCNHPDLITGGLDGSIMFPSADELVEQCGKFRLLDRLMTKLRAKGHKVLIFSQMTRMLDLIESFFEQRGGNFKVCRIDGSVQWQDRKTQMDLFNTDPEYGVFLLSTRAGGLGINLTAADTVIIYDSDWNPHQDMQAMDRCHRIGQTKPVHVLRLATAHSVEGKMLSRANSKLALEKLVITKGNFRQEIGSEANATLKGGRKKASGGGVSTDELIALLRGDVDEKDGVPQSADISDADLEMIMCRDDLLGLAKPNPRSGPGWEEVEDRSGMSLLGNVNKE